MLRRFCLSVQIFMGALACAPAALGQLAGYPAPRYPGIADITSVEQLMPNARYVVSKPGDKSANLRVGFGIQGGERILFLAQDTTDPLVVEALRRAFVEKGAEVDVLTMPRPKLQMEGNVDGKNEIWYTWAAFKSRTTLIPGLPPAARARSDSAALEAFKRGRNYDLIVGPAATVGNDNPYVSTWMPWLTREQLASTYAPGFPEEISRVIDRKGWEIIRQAKSMRFTDPEGTDMSWNWFPEYWEVVEGTNEEVKTKGGGPIVGPVAGYRYGRGSSEDPLIPGHLMAVPLGVVLSKSDARGVIAGTGNHAGPFPRIELTVDRHEITAIRGGGEYGELWRQVAEELKDVKYPLFPRKGHSFLIENSVGTNPKVVRPYNVMEGPVAKFSWVDERRRSGIVHWGIGTILVENEQWANEHGHPSTHYHVHQYFPTLEVTMQDGKKALLINKGRLTALDDPEVRQIAARFGDPDELLREDWIPAIPGINVPGDYLKDYGQNPYKWITEEHRKAYPEAIRRFQERGYSTR